MRRREPERVIKHIEQNGGRYLPCPKRKNRAMVDVQVCRENCRYARNCVVFQAWLRPPLDLGL